MQKYTRKQRQEIKDSALSKMSSYCRIYPRSHYEIRSKLYSMGLWKPEVEEVLSSLIAGNYVSEEKFAKHHTSKRFDKDNWGKEKIRQELIKKHVSPYNIKYVLSKIDDHDYKEKLYELARKKWDSIQGIEVDVFTKTRKTANYLLYKGYESKLIFEVLNEIKKEEI